MNEKGFLQHGNLNIEHNNCKVFDLVTQKAFMKNKEMDFRNLNEKIIKINKMPQ